MKVIIKKNICSIGNFATKLSINYLVTCERSKRIISSLNQLKNKNKRIHKYLPY